MSDLDLVAPFLDLDRAPFSLPGSRLLVRRAGEWLGVRTAEYERRLDDCVVADLRVGRDDGSPVRVLRVSPDRIELGDDEGTAVTATFAGPAALSLGPARPGVTWRVHVRTPTPVTDGAWRPSLPSAAGAELVVTGDMTLETMPDGLVASGQGEALLTTAAAGGAIAAGGHVRHLDETRRLWQEWFARRPSVRGNLAPIVALCWWVLGINQVPLHGHPGSRAVVPSLIGYVGLWQWDAYFIACGLRHGDPALAMHQLDLALAYPTAEGQLPDVVHDGGTLASSDDLPPGDLANLRRLASPAADPEAPVALTKPPLTAWAVDKVCQVAPDPQWRARVRPVIEASQEWWFSRSDADGDGMPEYAHPYSSGLDDSPIFDRVVPLASPDLGAYLVVQDDLLAAWAREAGEGTKAIAHERRRDRTLALLLAMWDGSRFRARGETGISPTDAVVGLLPLLTGRLEKAIATALRDRLSDPDAYATPWGVPTVAVDDSEFSPERMWRGPSWVNVNALLVDGLLTNGFVAEARELAERTIAMVVHAGGPHEYVNPVTGHKAERATSSFGWSAALVVDLAVRLSPGGDLA